MQDAAVPHAELPHADVWHDDTSLLDGAPAAAHEDDGSGSVLAVSGELCCISLVRSPEVEGAPRAVSALGSGMPMVWGRARGMLIGFGLDEHILAGEGRGGDGFGEVCERKAVG